MSRLVEDTCWQPRRGASCCITAALQPSLPKRRTLARRHGFFDVLSDAFANDETVSKLDYGDNAPAAAAQPPREASVDGLWRVEMIVVGVPTKDPSSDLFGPKQRVTQENRGIGGESVEATLRLTNGAVEVVELGAPARRRAGRLQVSGRQAAHQTRSDRLHADLHDEGHAPIHLRRRRHRADVVGLRDPAGAHRPGGPRRRAAVDGRAFVRKGQLLCQTTAGLFGAATKSSPAGSFTASAELPGRRRFGGLKIHVWYITYRADLPESFKSRRSQIFCQIHPVG